MTLFLICAGALVAVGLAFVLPPLWRAARPASDKRREANVTIYYQRCDEIERAVAGGRMTRGEAEREKDELGRRLLADIDETPALAPDARPARRPWLATLIIATVIVGVSVLGYWRLGDWQAINGAQMPDMATMIGELQQRVAADPGDLRARAMLARAQESVGAYEQAAQNYRALNQAIGEPVPALLAAEARATIQATGDVQGRAATLYRQLLDIDANNVEALWYLGLAAAERDDKAGAVDYWNRLLEQPDVPDDFRSMVRNRRNEIAGEVPRLSTQ